jgi:hypothetical protein
MNGLLQDFRYALRQFRKSSGFCLFVVAITALGIGATTAMFSVIHAVLLKPLAYRDPDKLVLLTKGITPVRFEEMKAASHSYSGLGTYAGVMEQMALSGSGTPEVLNVARVSANFLEILGLSPVLGRSFIAEEEKTGAPAVVMITEKLWQQRFGRDPQTIGRVINLAGVPHRIVGVLPAGFQFPFAGVDVWVTKSSELLQISPQSRLISPILTLFGRLEDQVSIQQANAELPVLKQQYASAHPGMLDGKPDVPESLLPLKDVLVSDMKRPMEGGVPFLNFAIPTRPLNAVTGLPTAAYRVVTPSYFTLIRNRLQDGRLFTEQDGPDTPPVIIVNESFSRTFMPGQRVLGTQVRLFFPTVTHEVKLAQIVGIVADSRQFSGDANEVLYEPSPPEFFLPLLQNPESARDLAVLVRTQGEAGTLTEPIRRQIQNLEPGQPVFDVQTLRALTDEALGPARLCLLILVSFAVTALAIACIGLYAIISYAVVRRTQEVGVRMALGAGRRQILNLILIQGMQVTALGIVAGLVASFGAARLMSSLLYRVSSHDFVTLTAVTVLVIGVASLASYIPARRAARVDPIVALRYE